MTWIVPEYTINQFTKRIGFLSTSDQHSRGNYGLWDMVELLEFIQTYITVFSGDPAKITMGYCLHLL